MARMLVWTALILVLLRTPIVTAGELTAGNRVMPTITVSARIAGAEADFNVVGWPATITEVDDETVQCGQVTLNKDGVVLLEDAEVYYTDIITHNDGNVGWAYGFRGITKESLKDDDGALADYSDGIRLSPDSVYPYYNRAKIWLKKKDFDSALIDYSKAIELDPELALPRMCRALIWELRSEYALAKHDLDEAVRIAPTYPGGYVGRAVLLSCCPDDKQRDGTMALHDAEAACELTKWESPSALAAMAMAYAELGDFDKAIEWHKRATMKAGSLVDETWIANLDLYKSKRPCRDLFQMVQFAN